jgi:hypothetical protein
LHPQLIPFSLKILRNVFATVFGEHNVPQAHNPPVAAKCGVIR